MVQMYTKFFFLFARPRPTNVSTPQELVWRSSFIVVFSRGELVGEESTGNKFLFLSGALAEDCPHPQIGGINLNHELVTGVRDSEDGSPLKVGKT